MTNTNDTVLPYTEINVTEIQGGNYSRLYYLFLGKISISKGENYGHHLDTY